MTSRSGASQSANAHVTSHTEYRCTALLVWVSDWFAQFSRWKLNTALGVKARTSRLFSLFFGYLDKKLKVLDYAIKTT